MHGGRPRLEADRFECRSDGGRGRPVVELERERVARDDLLGFGDQRLDVIGAHTGADGASPSSRGGRSVEPAVPALHQVVPHLRRWLPVPASDLGGDRVVVGVSAHRHQCRQSRRGPLRSGAGHRRALQCEASRACRLRTDLRSGPMREVWIRKCKRPSAQAVWGAYEVARDEHGVWLYTPEGSRFRSTSDDGTVGECFVGQPEAPGLHVMQLVPSGDAWWFGHWKSFRGHLTVSIDLCTPAVFAGDAWTYVDLELDVYRAGDGTIGVLRPRTSSRRRWLTD